MDDSRQMFLYLGHQFALLCKSNLYYPPWLSGIRATLLVWISWSFSKYHGNALRRVLWFKWIKSFHVYIAQFELILKTPRAMILWMKKLAQSCPAIWLEPRYSSFVHPNHCLDVYVHWHRASVETEAPFIWHPGPLELSESIVNTNALVIGIWAQTGLYFPNPGLLLSLSERSKSRTVWFHQSPCCSSQNLAAPHKVREVERPRGRGLQSLNAQEF